MAQGTYTIWEIAMRQAALILSSAVLMVASIALMEVGERTRTAGAFTVMSLIVVLLHRRFRNRAVVYGKFSELHSGSFFDLPASGKQVAINGVDIFRVKDGQFTEQWHVEELASLFAQMGAK